MEGPLPTLDEYNHLSRPELARLLSDAGEQPVTVAMLRADVTAGAPTNPDGTIDLVRYVAWLLARRAEKKARFG